MILYVSIVGSVVEFSPATREARVQFPDDAIIFFEGCNYNIVQTSTCIFFFYQMYHEIAERRFILSSIIMDMNLA